MTFAVITPALIVGGFAERMRFSSVLVFSSLWLLLVYAPVCHWIWGGGWLASTWGVMDFAGGLVVHLIAGAAALVAAVQLGSRLGSPDRAMPPHNLTLSVMGAGMLWVGWFGFNGGSALAANGDAGMAMLATHISAAAAAFIWMMAEQYKYGKPSILGAITGMVAGLGTITPASGFVGPGGALVIGISAGIICFVATGYLKRSHKIHGSLDVFSVHGVGGLLGTLMTAVFASNALGISSGQEEIDIGSQFTAQLVGVLAVFIYTALLTFIILKIVGAFGAASVTEEDELDGLDIISHNEQGYDLYFGEILIP